MTIELPASAKFITRDGTQVLSAHTELCDFEVSAGGAHITSWIPQGFGEVLWVSPLTSYAVGEPIRGGIPLIGPWFSFGRSGEEKPHHGWFRRSLWEFVSVSELSDATLEITLRISGEHSTEKFPVAGATLVIRAGSTLSVELSVTAGDAPLELEAALHTYFQVGDVREAVLRGLGGVHFTDATNDRISGTGTDPMVFEGHTDSVFEASPNLVLEDPANSRAINIEQINGTRTVVWTPWEEDVHDSKDMPDSQWNKFLCAETAVSEGGFALVQPGETFTFGATYSVSELS